MNNSQSIFKKAIKHEGPDIQFNMAIEECAELIQAIQKYKRKPTLDRIENLHEEIADVSIMLSI